MLGNTYIENIGKNTHFLQKKVLGQNCKKHNEKYKNDLHKFKIIIFSKNAGREGI